MSTSLSELSREELIELVEEKDRALEEVRQLVKNALRALGRNPD